MSNFHDENARSVRQRILLGQNGRLHGLPDTTLTVLNVTNVGTLNTGGGTAESARDLRLGFMASFDDTCTGKHVEMTGGPFGGRAQSKCRYRGSCNSARGDQRTFP